MRRCPFIALERNKEEQTSAKAGTKRRSIIADSTSDGVGSSNGQHTAASGGYRFFFRLLTGVTEFGRRFVRQLKNVMKRNRHAPAAAQL
jgi:hypothetical protein